MTSVSRRRPASRLGFSFLLLILLTSAGSAAARTVVLDTPEAGRDDMRRWRDDDVRWLRELPVTHPSSATVPVDSLAAGDQAAWDDLRRRIQASAGKDSLHVMRTIDALLRDRWADRGFLSAKVAVRGDTAYVATTDRGVLVLDVADPAQPAEVGRVGNLVAFHVYLDGDGTQDGGEPGVAGVQVELKDGKATFTRKDGTLYQGDKA